MNPASIALISLIVSVVVFTWNVYDRLVTRSHDRKSKAPYLMTEQFGITWISDICEIEVSLTVRNCGTNPAHDVRGEIVMVLDMDEEPYGGRAMIPKLRFDAVNGLAGGISHTAVFRLCMPAYLPAQSVKVSLQCADPFTGERFRPCFYYKWGGLDNGVPRFAVKSLTREGCEKLDVYLATPDLFIP